MIGDFIEDTLSNMKRFFITLGVTLGVFILLIWLICLEWVDVGFSALNYDSISGHADLTETYPAGVHTIGLFNSFIIFPIIPIEVDSSLTSRTKDKIALTISYALYYNLEEKSIGTKIYSNFLLDFQTPFDLMIGDIVRDEISLHELSEFYSSARAGISTNITNRLTAFFSQFDVTVRQFELKRVAIPEDLDEAIDEAQTAQESVNTAVETLAQTKITAETKVIEAETAATIKLVAAEGTSTAIVNSAYAKTIEVNKTTIARVEALKKIKTTLGFNNTQLLQYLKYNALKDHGDDHLLLQLKKVV
eukprot:TRINITY_DN2532_c0_g1_i1.p1 TRINITY_DN2532_c0_g1~~TRINITY_DN2532_c0_g1_i1.p1  ORF type:complete len:318 (+),score=76.76 TRINITY_DN2532_c0_g1_i1:40-954(+)